MRKRCSRIVRSVLQFSRGESAEKWPDDLNELVSRCCKLMGRLCAGSEGP